MTTLSGPGEPTVTRGLALSPGLILTAVLGLALAAGLWWTYFDRDDRRAEHRVGALDGPARARAALNAFGYGHFLMLGGVVVLAAGIKGVVAHPGAHASLADAGNLGGGLALYLLGDVLYRRLLGIGPGGLRLVAAVLAGLTVPLGLLAGGLVQLAACVGLLVGLLLVEARTRPAEDEDGAQPLGTST